MEQELEVLLLADLEDVPADEFLDQALPQFGGDLEGVDSEGEQDLDDALDVVVGHMLLQLAFVLLDHVLADEFAAFHFPFVDDDFVVFPQLDLVVLDGLVQAVVLGPSFLDVVDDLQQIYGNGEDLPTRLQHLLVFFLLHFVFLLQL